MELSNVESVGFIGLGAMGKLMAGHLATKLPPTSKLYVYDVVHAPVEELVNKFPGKVVAGQSPKHVAQHAVCICGLFCHCSEI